MHQEPAVAFQAQRVPGRVNPLLLVPVLVFLALTSALGGYAWGLGRLVTDNLPRMSGSFPADAGRPVSAAADAQGRTPLTVLFLGSDQIPANAADPGYSSDTVLLVHVNAARSRADVIAVPGDAIVTIPGVGRDRVSSASTRGGVPLAVSTVEHLLGSRIDHVVVMDLAGVQAMTDAVGGVEVDVQQPFRAGDRQFTAGRHRLDGEAALAFVREQRSLPGRQAERISNQSVYLHALVDELAARGILSDPSRLQAFLTAAAENTSVDEALTSSRMRELAVGMRNLRPADTRFQTLPTTAWRTAADRPTVVNVDEAGVARLKACLRADDLAACDR